MMVLYKKKEVLFAVMWIVIYVVGSSVMDQLSEQVGMAQCLTIPFHLILIAGLLTFIVRNGLQKKYGLCRAIRGAGVMLWYVPLAVLASVNLWLGATQRMPFMESAFYACSMLLTGVLEELIFRGLLFRAMSRSNVRSAIVVSSLTFGIGHIVNLINGSGTNVLSNLLQVMYAVAIGFAFVEVFYRGGSLIPCILCHSVFNALSTFSNEAAWTPGIEIIVSVILIIVAAGYGLWLAKKVPVDDKTADTNICE